MPHGWHYDKTAGHKESGPDSPQGMQWGMLLVSRQLADEAIAKWPELITELSDGEAESFYNERASAHIPEDKTDHAALQGLKAERDLLIDLGRSTTEVDSRIGKALDPLDATQPGKRRNLGSNWTRFKSDKGVSFDANVRRDG